MSTYYVTVTPTIMDGTVVRWFGSEEAMRSVRPIVSASRNRVSGHSGGEITPELFEAAWSAHQALKRGDNGAVVPLETHRSRGFLSDEYEPVGASR